MKYLLTQIQKKRKDKDVAPYYKKDKLLSIYNLEESQTIDRKTKDFNKAICHKSSALTLSWQAKFSHWKW